MWIGAEDLKRGLEPFEKIRAAVGDKMEIAAELHSLWSRPMAVKIAQALEPISADVGRRPGVHGPPGLDR